MHYSVQHCTVKRCPNKTDLGEQSRGAVTYVAPGHSSSHPGRLQTVTVYRVECKR